MFKTHTNLCFWLVWDLVRGTPDHSMVVERVALGAPDEANGCLDRGIAQHKLLIILGGCVEADLQQTTQVQFDLVGRGRGRGGGGEGEGNKIVNIKYPPCCHDTVCMHTILILILCKEMTPRHMLINEGYVFHYRE